MDLEHVNCGGKLVALPDTYGQGRHRVELLCQKCDKYVGAVDDVIIQDVQNPHGKS